jgi:murein DD-endopeptidase MepM/ murein hydrolase activator NlpD
MYQGYGNTWAVKNTWVGRIYNFHNGIDIIGSSTEVKAVADGTLYRGSYSVGCPLLYVKLAHKDSNITTLYLHVYAK